MSAEKTIANASFLPDKFLTMPKTTSQHADNSSTLCNFGDWSFDYSKNALKLISSQESKRLEPKVSDLLKLLIEANGEVIEKEKLICALWPDVIVGEDTLSRTVSRLRFALNDSAIKSEYIETIPKKGYRFKAQVNEHSPTRKPTSNPVFIGVFVLLLIAAMWVLVVPTQNSQIEEMLTRADGLYMSFSEQNNEAALALYEQVSDIEPDNAHARAGIANALVQRLVRWPSSEHREIITDASLSKALASGQLSTPQSKLMLERARFIAEKAIRLDPTNTNSIKSLGFVYSAEGKIDQAIEQYQKAIKLDHTAWRSLVNLGELYLLKGDLVLAQTTLIKAFEAMQLRYQDEPQNIGPWQPKLGNMIARQFLQQNDHPRAQAWAQRILSIIPFNREALTILILALLAQQNEAEARRLCDDCASQLAPLEVCSF